MTRKVSAMGFCAYTDGDTPFRSKKAFREAVAGNVPVTLLDCSFIRPQPDVSIRDGEASTERAGVFYVEGPDPLRGVPNKWYAQVTVQASGKVVVK